MHIKSLALPLVVLTSLGLTQEVLPKSAPGLLLAQSTTTPKVCVIIGGQRVCFGTDGPGTVLSPSSDSKSVRDLLK